MARTHALVVLALLCVLVGAGCADMRVGPKEPTSPVDVGDPGVGADADPDNPHAVPAEFVEAVLADGVVTFEEFVLAHQRKFECMVEGGLDGEVAFDPVVGLDGPSKISHVSAELLELVLLGCELSIAPITGLYARDNPDTPQRLERRRLGILGCVRRDAPSVYAKLSEDWDLETLRLWLYDRTAEDAGEADAVAAADCVNSAGAPWLSLREAAGLAGD